MNLQTIFTVKFTILNYKNLIQIFSEVILSTLKDEACTINKTDKLDIIERDLTNYRLS